jgi:hypothetical protein
MDLLIDGLFNLGQRRLRMGRSPLRDGGKDFLSLFVPTRLQVFGLHLSFLSSWLVGQLLSSSSVYHLLAHPLHPFRASRRRKKMHRTSSTATSGSDLGNGWERSIGSGQRR